jgi:hypothetical protein
VDQIRRPIVELTGALLASMALIHLLDLPDTISSTPYIGVMYIGLIVTAMLVAALLVRSSHAGVWKTTALLATAVIAGCTLSRTTGLPGSTDDIGNWGQSLGIASLFVEGSLVALSAGVLRGRTRRQLQVHRARRSAARTCAPTPERPRARPQCGSRASRSI